VQLRHSKHVPYMSLSQSVTVCYSLLLRLSLHALHGGSFHFGQYVHNEAPEVCYVLLVTVGFVLCCAADGSSHFASYVSYSSTAYCRACGGVLIGDC
jgi:hypothetical protein